MAKQVTTQYMKPLSELTLLDRFLFDCAMEDQRIMELTLQVI